MTNLEFQSEEVLHSALEDVCKRIRSNCGACEGGIVSSVLDDASLRQLIDVALAQYAKPIRGDDATFVDAIVEFVRDRDIDGLDARSASEYVCQAVSRLPRRTRVPWFSFALGIVGTCATWMIWFLAFPRGNGVGVVESYWITLACISIATGHLIVSALQLALLKVFRDLTEGDHKAWGVMSGAVVGVVERPFFCLAVAFNLGGCIVGMFAWITLRNVTLWTRVNAEPVRHFSALLMSFTSVCVALVAGLILRWLQQL